MSKPEKVPARTRDYVDSYMQVARAAHDARVRISLDHDKHAGDFETCNSLPCIRGRMFMAELSQAGR